MTARAEPRSQADEPHLLVVDDDARLRDLLRRYLVDQGFRVTTAGDAAEARAKIKSLDFEKLPKRDEKICGRCDFDSICWE